MNVLDRNGTKEKKIQTKKMPEVQIVKGKIFLGHSEFLSSEVPSS